MGADRGRHAISVGQRDRVVEGARPTCPCRDGVAVEGRHEGELVTAGSAVLIGERVGALGELMDVLASGFRAGGVRCGRGVLRVVRHVPNTRT